MPETDLVSLLRFMSPRLAPGRYVFVTVGAVPAGLNPVMTFREAEGITLILARDAAIGAGLSWSFPSRMITLGINSSLDAIGFLAAVSAELAKVGIPVNAVSAFHHDHLFVPEERAEEAMGILQTLASRN